MVYLSKSRKEWLADKHVKQLNEKIRHSTRRMKTSFAVISASVLVSNLVEPVRQVMAEEKASENIKRIISNSENPFLNTLIPSASQIAQKNDLYASVMLAQAILESGWGNSQLASAPNHNLFGIKGSYQGESTNMDTLEDSGNQNYYEIQADFRKYPSYHESLEDYASLLRNGISSDPLFYDGVWKSNADSYQDATAYLTGRYATDTAYNTKLNGIIESNGLAQYDSPSYTPPVVNEEQVEGQNETDLVTDTYIVKSGDTLSGIASKYSIGVNDLMSYNSLNSTLLYPGDQLKVLKKASTVETVTPEKQENKPEQDKPVFGLVYKVTPGDSLWKIAQLNGVSVAQLKEWNNLSSDVIQPGQGLQMTNSAIQEETVPEKEQTTPVENDFIQSQPVSETITVKSGDTLYRIAVQSGTTVSQIKEWNQLTSDLILPGQTLSIQSTNKETPVISEEIKEVEVEEIEEIEEQSNDARENIDSPAYIVKNGDTLYKIANQAGVSVSQIKEWNQLSSDTILIGQKIITNAKLIEEKTEVSPNEDVQESSQSHEIKTGDTLYSLANQYGVSVIQLIEWNNVTSNLIFVGQQLRVK